MRDKDRKVKPSVYAGCRVLQHVPTVSKSLNRCKGEHGSVPLERIYRVYNKDEKEMPVYASCEDFSLLLAVIKCEHQHKLEDLHVIII